jgi:uncharacterized cofD-like protein
VSESPPPACRALKAVALGGGHGLHASLSALRTITSDLTAVVTVADDGGSSGRIRRELKVLPPGDLRMALVALAGAGAEQQRWAELLQHRLGGTGVLSGHPLGNLLLTGLLEREDDAVGALQRLGSLVGAVGRVLPMSPVPLDIIAEADRFDPDDPDRVREIRGQSSVAATPGRVRAVRLLPPGAPACAQAVDAVREADVVVLGPGSWFTSVIPHLLLHELGLALATTTARVLVTLNLVPQAGETDEYSPVELLRVLGQHAERHGGGLRVDAVIADERAVVDPKELAAYTQGLGAHLVLSRLAADDAADRHDPQRLGCAFRQALQDPAVAGGGEGVDGWR